MGSGQSTDPEVQVLARIYALSGGEAEVILRRSEVRAGLDLPSREIQRVLRVLVRQGFIRHIVFRSLCLTRAGVAAAERAGTGGDVPHTPLHELTRLRGLLETRFSIGDLRILCFDLGIDYDNLAGTGKAERAHALVVYLERHGRVADLVELVQRTRPDVPWEGV